MFQTVSVFLAFVPYMAFAFVLSLVLTRLAILTLPIFGMVDVPHGRHQHTHPVPRGGGFAIWIAFALTILMSLYIFSYLYCPFYAEYKMLVMRLAVPSVMILILGGLDDKYELRSYVKLAGQILIGCVIYFSGCGINNLLGYNLPIYAGLPATIFWCIIIINAFNLIDGLDGIAAGIASISSFLLAIWFLISNDSISMAAVLLMFCGACLGFLKYNFSPAKIFLGDTGSMFIGLFFAFVSMHSSAKAATFTALLVPVLALGIPMFDVCLAIWRRFFRRYIKKDTNSSIMQGDHDHLHHRIQKETGQQKVTAYIIYGLSATISIAAMVSVFMDKKLPALIFLLFLIIAFVFVHYAYIELYDTISSISDGVRTPHRNLLFTAIHPVIDTLLVLTALLICRNLYSMLFPTKVLSIWILASVAPFTICLCASGIYRTFWLRTGIRRYGDLIRYLILSGVVSFVFNYMICAIFLNNTTDDVKKFCGWFLAFYLLSVMLIFLERFLIHYFESFGFRHLYNKRFGKNGPSRKVLIYGGGLFCRLYLTYTYSGFSSVEKDTIVVGICDDNLALKGLNVYGFQVYGDSDHLEDIYKRVPFTVLMITVKEPDMERYNILQEFCSRHNVELKTFTCREK